MIELADVHARSADSHEDSVHKLSASLTAALGSIEDTRQSLVAQHRASLLGWLTGCLTPVFQVNKSFSNFSFFSCPARLLGG